MQRVKNFAAFRGRSPGTATFEDVRRYQLHLATSSVDVASRNQTVAILRFFFRVTLKRPRYRRASYRTRSRFLDAAPGLKYKAALSVAYGAGLRTNESSVHMADINKPVSLHTLAAPLCHPPARADTDVSVIQALLGHSKLDRTALYTRVATKTSSEITSPREHIALKLKEMR